MRKKRGRKPRVDPKTYSNMTAMLEDFRTNVEGAKELIEQVAMLDHEHIAGMLILSHFVESKNIQRMEEFEERLALLSKTMVLQAIKDEKDPTKLLKLLTNSGGDSESVGAKVIEANSPEELMAALQQELDELQEQTGDEKCQKADAQLGQYL